MASLEAAGNSVTETELVLSVFMYGQCCQHQIFEELLHVVKDLNGKALMLTVATIL